MAYKIYKSLFSSNNRLYSYLRLNKYKEAKRLLKKIFIINVFVYPVAFTDISTIVRIIKNFSNVFKDIGTGYGFKN